MVTTWDGQESDHNLQSKLYSQVYVLPGEWRWGKQSKLYSQVCVLPGEWGWGRQSKLYSPVCVLPGPGGTPIIFYSLGGDVPLGSRKSYPLLDQILPIL